MWEILKQIWELPWYEVLIIAVCDDAILFVKIWPLYMAIIILYIYFMLY